MNVGPWGGWGGVCFKNNLPCHWAMKGWCSPRDFGVQCSLSSVFSRIESTASLLIPSRQRTLSPPPPLMFSHSNTDRWGDTHTNTHIHGLWAWLGGGNLPNVSCHFCFYVIHMWNQVYLYVNRPARPGMAHVVWRCVSGGAVLKSFKPKERVQIRGRGRGMQGSAPAYWSSTRIWCAAPGHAVVVCSAPGQWPGSFIVWT